MGLKPGGGDTGRAVLSREGGPGAGLLCKAEEYPLLGFTGNCVSGICDLIICKKHTAPMRSCAACEHSAREHSLIDVNAILLL